MNDTDIEIGSIWVQADIKYEIVGIENQRADNEILVWYNKYGTCLGNKEVATRFTFLKDFTPYKPEYKYQYVWKHASRDLFNAITSHLADKEAAEMIAAFPLECYQKIEASKIEI